MTIHTYNMTVSDASARGYQLDKPITICGHNPSSFNQANLNRCAELADEYFRIMFIKQAASEAFPTELVLKLPKNDRLIINNMFVRIISLFDNVINDMRQLTTTQGLTLRF